MIAGTYTFVYTVRDLSLNESSVTRTIYVMDNSGPVISGNDLINRIIEIGLRNNDGSINVSDVAIRYPTAYDTGDDSAAIVEYVGLFSTNKMGEKYKVTDDIYLISNINDVLTYKFNVVGTYYLRFSSSDNSGNISLFEYEVKVVDKVAPLINGVVNDLIVKVGLEDTFDVEKHIIEPNNVKAIDNYDSNVKVYYDVIEDEIHTYKVVLNAKDNSNNLTSIIVYVDIVDEEAPVAGQLVLPDQTNLNSLEIKIVGGEDNSNNYYHEYKVQNGAWNRYEKGTIIELGAGLSQKVKVCIRAVDASGNVSSNNTCKEVLVDTKKPIVSGVNDGDILDKEVEVNVSDDRLELIEVMLNGEKIEVTKDDMPFTFSEIGTYSIVAKDTLGNETIVNFMLNIDLYFDVANDINSDNYIVTSVEYDERMLVKVDVNYDNTGSSTITTNLDHISVNANDMIYVLGVVPGSDAKFVMYSLSGSDLENYTSDIKLIGDENKFKEDIENEDCFLKLNGSYYAYLIVQKDSYVEPVIVEKENEKSDNSKSFTIVIGIIGGLATGLVAYQILRFRKKIRAA